VDRWRPLSFRRPCSSAAGGAGGSGPVFRRGASGSESIRRACRKKRWSAAVALGASLEAWTKIRTPADVITVLLFSCLCWINCAAIEKWESSGGIEWPVGAAALCVGAAAFLLLYEHRPVLGGAEMASALAFLLLDRGRRRFSADALRAGGCRTAESVLFCPSPAPGRKNSFIRSCALVPLVEYATFENAPTAAYGISHTPMRGGCWCWAMAMAGSWKSWWAQPAGPRGIRTGRRMLDGTRRRDRARTYHQADALEVALPERGYDLTCALLPRLFGRTRSRALVSGPARPVPTPSGWSRIPADAVAPPLLAALYLFPNRDREDRRLIDHHPLLARRLPDRARRVRLVRPAGVRVVGGRLRLDSQWTWNGAWIVERRLTLRSKSFKPA
jgi:hypothetical protein